MKKRNLVLSVMTTCLVSCFLLSGCNGQKQIDSETVKTVKVEEQAHLQDDTVSPACKITIDYSYLAESDAADSIAQRINLLNKPILILIGCISLFFAALIYLFTQISRDEMGVYSTLIANILLFSIILLFILWGLWKKINVYAAFIEGAKEGFTTAVRIIPYLVAFLVGIAVFRTSGAMDILVNGIGYVVGLFGVDTSFVGALPTALMKSLSGSGANGLMIDTMKQYGPDSFVSRMSCVARGASDTTFYILAVYFGSVGITKTRNAVTCGLIADFSGIIAAIIISYLFFF